MYDNVLYKVLEPKEHINDVNDKILKLYSYEVVYIPSDTKEDKNSYLEQAKKRIDNNLKTNIKIEEHIIEDTTPSKEARQNYLKTQLEYGYKNNYIDKELNKFEPVFATATIEDKTIDDKYYINFIIAKGTNKQLGITSDVNEKCSEKDGKYYDKNGNEVSQEAYENSCNITISKCQEKDGKYYDKNGKSVAKEEYLKSCGLVDNPQTGVEIPLALLILIGVFGFHLFLKNKNYFQKI